MRRSKARKSSFRARILNGLLQFKPAGMTAATKDSIKVGITTGDINGIGPEIIVKCFKDRRMFENMTAIVYGNNDLFKQVINKNGIHDFKYNGVKSTDQAIPGKLNIFNVWNDKVEVEPGKPSKQTGEFAFKSLKAAVDDLASNKIDVLVTAPIDKNTIQSDEFDFPGHTEYLAKLSNVDDHLMLLMSGELRVGVVTGHIPIKDVSENLTSEKVLGKINLLQDTLIKDFKKNKPRIAVLGLNPHAGDEGLIGSEEKDVIAPAIRQAQDDGVYVYGPYGADGFFGAGAFKEFDGILAMYHDQGLVPFKTLAFDTGVNYTAGLPIVRTSPDHGTGYDIAGKGIASPDSLRHAIFSAIDIFRNRKYYKEITANPLELQKSTA